MPPAPHSDQIDVERANLAVYRAFESLDLEAMSALWVQDGSASCLHPGWEPLRGWDEVRGSWESIFASTDWIRFTLSDVDVMVSGSLAVVRLTEQIASATAGQSYIGRATATNVFVRSAGGWLLLHHQASTTAAGEAEDNDDDATLH